MKKRIVVGATGASGQPLLIKCLEIIRESEEFESYLIMTESARLTLESETTWKVEEVEALADHVLNPEEIGAGPASGSFRTAGMVIVPCSMKTTASPGTRRKRNTAQSDSSPESAGTLDDAGRPDHSADDDFLSLSGEH